MKQQISCKAWMTAKFRAQSSLHNFPTSHQILHPNTIRSTWSMATSHRSIQSAGSQFAVTDQRQEPSPGSAAHLLLPSSPEQKDCRALHGDLPALQGRLEEEFHRPLFQANIAFHLMDLSMDCRTCRKTSPRRKRTQRRYIICLRKPARSILALESRYCYD